MKPKLFVILAVIGLLLVTSIACSKVEGSQNVQRNTHKNLEVTIDEFMQGKNVVRSMEINKGDTLTLILGSNPSTGFRWTENAQISDPAVMKQTKHEFVVPAIKDPQPGAAGKEVWNFDSLKAGTTKISAEYSRPWEGGEQGEWTFDLTVIVK